MFRVNGLRNDFTIAPGGYDGNYDQFAVQAFDVNAIDYLLKPYTRARFDQAMQRVLARLQQQAPEPREPGPALDQLVALMQQMQPTSDYLERLFVRSGSRIVPIAAADILHIEGAGDYVNVHTGYASHLATVRLNELEQRLNPQDFIRVHRSSIIALNAIRFLESDGDGGFTITLTNRTKVRVSRSYAEKIKPLIR